LKKVLLAGPWIGEFGWELFCWHSYVRALSVNYDETVCVSTPHSKFMYEDFCNKFVEFTPNRGDYKDSYYKIGFSLEAEEMKNILSEAGLEPGKQKITMFAPRRIGDPPRTHYTDKFKFGSHIIAPKYIKFGKELSNSKKEVIFHARNRSLRPQDNWSEQKWNKLAQNLLSEGHKVSSIGLRSESLHIDGTTDKRECEQQTLLDTLANAKCIFGPSSGAMHLASLCGCPQIVWTTDYNLDRYTKNWNPFDTKVLFLSEQGWQPSVDYIFENFKRL
jgi:hypothetical protein